MDSIYFGKRKSNRTYFLLIYDIADNKRRTKCAKLLEGYGVRVQLSAFEFWLDDSKRNRMMKRLNQIIEKEDNIRIYELDSDQSDYFQWKKDELLSRCDVVLI